jgi:dTDP-4-dehydrorhamnose 3,5-epimerase
MGIDEEIRLFEPVVHADDRGSFCETYNQRTFDEWLGEPVTFVQDNHSKSMGGVVRGLHYQLPPAAQAKLVRVTRGAVFDVVVDIRRSSPTFGEWRGFDLSEETHRQLWIPQGFAHGFLVLGDGAEVQYKTTTLYAAEHDRAIRWDDPTIGIEWPLGETSPLLSRNDASAPTLDAADLFD